MIPWRERRWLPATNGDPYGAVWHFSMPRFQPWGRLIREGCPVETASDTVKQLQEATDFIWKGWGRLHNI